MKFARPIFTGGLGGALFFFLGPHLGFERPQNFLESLAAFLSLVAIAVPFVFLLRWFGDKEYADNTLAKGLLFGLSAGVFYAFLAGAVRFFGV